jgi:hypothetical protein
MRFQQLDAAQEDDDVRNHRQNHAHGVMAVCLGDGIAGRSHGVMVAYTRQYVNYTRQFDRNT